LEFQEFHEFQEFKATDSAAGDDILKIFKIISAGVIIDHLKSGTL